VQAQRLVNDTEEELDIDADEMLATFTPFRVESHTGLSSDLAISCVLVHDLGLSECP